CGRVEFPRTGEECVRRGLTWQVLLPRDQTIDHHVEKVADLCAFEHVTGVRARRYDSSAQAGSAHLADVVDRSWVHLDAVVTDLREDEIVLAIAQPVNRVRPRRVIFGTFGQVDPT